MYHGDIEAAQLKHMYLKSMQSFRVLTFSLSGSAFSGPSELPPEFANVGFGIGGDNGLNFNVPAPEKKNEVQVEPPKRPVQRYGADLQPH